MNKEDLKIGEFYVNINLYPHSAPNWIRLEDINEKDNYVKVIVVDSEDYINEKLKYKEGYEIQEIILNYFLSNYKLKQTIYEDIYSNINRLKLIGD